MGRLWTPEERRIVHKMRGGDELLYEDIAQVLRENGYTDRTAEAVRCMLRRDRTAPAVKDNDTALVVEELPTRILYFDIETTNLDASFGELLMMGYRWHHERHYNVINIYDYDGWNELEVEKRDYMLLQDAAEIIAQADLLIGHYSVKFDHRFVQTRLLMQGLPPIPDTPQIDTWSIAKYQLKLRSNRLAALAEALGCKNQKAKLPIYIWRRTVAHDENALRRLSKYCLQDVKTQYDVTQKLLPITKKMPNWSLLTGTKKFRCPACGSTNVVQKGYRYTNIQTYKRMRCNNCGKWMRGRSTVAPKDAERLVY